MNIVNFKGEVLFSSACAVLKDAVIEALHQKVNLSYADLRGANLSSADLSGADLSGADLSRANLSGADLRGAYLSRADLSRANLSGAYLSDAYLSGADLSGAYLSDAYLRGKKVKKMRVFSGLYPYVIYAVLFDDGERWIRMGCLWYSLKTWNKIGVAKSNLSEFPDDKSEKSLERKRAFAFAKATVLAMK